MAFREELCSASDFSHVTQKIKTYNILPKYMYDFCSSIYDYTDE